MIDPNGNDQIMLFLLIFALIGLFATGWIVGTSAFEILTVIRR